MRNFNVGDQVKIDEEFEGSVTVAGWKLPEIESYIFEVVTFDDYRQTNPKFAKTIKDKPSSKGEVFLKHESTIFALSPSHALRIVKKAPPRCRCPILQLWNGVGHYTSCPEKP